MSVKLLTEQHLKFLILKEAAHALLSLHLSKCHIVGNHVSRLNLWNQQCTEKRNGSVVDCAMRC